MRAAAGVGYTTATDLADWLVREKGVPFREAHGVAARVVRLAETKGCGLEALTLAELQEVDPRIEAAALAVLSVDSSVASRRSVGGTAPGARAGGRGGRRGALSAAGDQGQALSRAITSLSARGAICGGRARALASPR